VKAPVSTETAAGPAEQGEKREKTGSMRPMNNADRRDSASVECIGTFTTGCSDVTRVWPLAPPGFPRHQELARRRPHAVGDGAVARDQFQIALVEPGHQRHRDRDRRLWVTDQRRHD